MTDERVHLLAAPLFDPGAGRIELMLPAGLSLAEMIDLSPLLTFATWDDLAALRASWVACWALSVLWQIGRASCRERV